MPPALESITRRIGWVKVFVGWLRFPQRHFLPNVGEGETADRTVLELVVYRPFCRTEKGECLHRVGIVVDRPRLDLLVIGLRVSQGALPYQGACTRTFAMSADPSAIPHRDYCFDVLN